MAASLIGVPLAGTPGGLTVGSDALVVQVWDRNGVQRFVSQPQRPLPQYAAARIQHGRRPTAGDWRVFSTLAGDEVVQVAQPMSVRRELAASMALRTIIPLLIVAPLLALFIGLGIARGLAPARAPRGRGRQAHAGRPYARRRSRTARGSASAGRMRSTGCCRGSIAHSARSARSLPMPPTSCARR